MIKVAFCRKNLGYRPRDERLAKTAEVASRLAIDPRSNYYLDSWAVSAYERFGLNENCDGFERDQLKLAYRSFVGSWVCLDHQNWDESLSVGSNVDAVYMPDDYVRVAMAVDRERSEARHPGLEQKIARGHVTDTSMGVYASESMCTIPVCANVARDESEFCEHVLPSHLGGMRGQILNDRRTGWKPVRCGELNRGLHFFENTIITTDEGADRNAKILAKLASVAKRGSNADAILRAMREVARDASPEGIATLARLTVRLTELVS